MSKSIYSHRVLYMLTNDWHTTQFIDVKQESSVEQLNSAPKIKHGSKLSTTNDMQIWKSNTEIF